MEIFMETSFFSSHGKSMLLISLINKSRRFSNVELLPYHERQEEK
jgi:hypothetical protein